MLASLQATSVALNIPILRKACFENGKIDWSQEMIAEYQEANQLMLTQIKLSPYDPEKALYLVVDGGSKVGTGFCLLQRVKVSDPTKEFLIINAWSSLLPTTKGEFLPVEAEAISLDRARTSCHHWLYVQEIHLISDCSGLLGLLNKDLCKMQIEGFKI